MVTGVTTVERIRHVILGVLSVEVTSDDADLIEEGLIDSLGLVSIIAEIEHEFQVELALEDFNPDYFRSVNRIAAFVAEAASPGDMSSPVANST
jgi:acyl carrier protein